MDCRLGSLTALRRPRLLVRAAQLAQKDYDSGRHSRRLLPTGENRTPEETLDHLVAREAEMNEARRTGGATYSPAQHVALLAALIFEVRQIARAGS